MEVIEGRAPGENNPLDFWRHGLAGFVIAYKSQFVATIKCPLKSFEPDACFTCVDSQVIACTELSAARYDATVRQYGYQKGLTMSEPTVPTRVTTETAKDLPIEELRKLNVFNLRSLATNLGILTDPRAWAGMSREAQAQAIFDALRRNGHAAPTPAAAPVVEAPPPPTPITTPPVQPPPPPPPTPTAPVTPAKRQAVAALPTQPAADPLPAIGEVLIQQSQRITELTGAVISGLQEVSGQSAVTLKALNEIALTQAALSKQVESLTALTGITSTIILSFAELTGVSVDDLLTNAVKLVAEGTLSNRLHELLEGAAKADAPKGRGRKTKA